MSGTHRHRPTGGKQLNKLHKSSHASKNEIHAKNKGKIENFVKRPAPKDLSKTLANSKQQRKNKAKQILENKREATIMAKRLGTSKSAPKIVVSFNLFS